MISLRTLTRSFVGSASGGTVSAFLRAGRVSRFMTRPGFSAKYCFSSGRSMLSISHAVNSSADVTPQNSVSNNSVTQNFFMLL